MGASMGDSSQSQEAREGAVQIQAGGNVGIWLGVSYADVKAMIAEERERIVQAVLERAQEMLQDAGIQPGPVPIKALVPLLQYASLEDDAYLQERWAALLANSAHPEQGAHVQPSFPDILRQLSSPDAKFLDAIHGFVLESHRRHFGLDSPLDANRAQYEPILSPDSTLPDLFAKAGLANVNPSELYTSNPPESHADLIRKDRSAMAVSLDNLRRLGLGAHRQKSKIERRPKSLDEPKLKQESEYHLTALGFEFVTACRRPKKAEPK